MKECIENENDSVNTNVKIDNLIRYFESLFNEKSNNRKSALSRKINLKTVDIKEEEFKKIILQSFKTDNSIKPWVNPTDILIMSINCIEKVNKQINLEKCHKFAILWIMCLLNAKCISAHDHEYKMSIDFLSNLAGFQVKDYNYFERILLLHLDWRLEISISDYQRLSEIGNNKHK